MLHDRDIRNRVPAPAVPARPEGIARPLATGVELGPARWRELFAVARLQQRAFRPGLAYGRTTLVALWLLPRVRFLVARRGARIVGCAIGDRHEGHARIINLAVEPEARRQGIGSALLRGLEAALPRGDVLLMVQTENTLAQALYRREGYLAVGTADDYYGRGRPGIWMQKTRTTGGRPPTLPKSRV